jgi:methylated-DNA-protein-cysteine methyltransferase-like protein
MFSRNYLLTEAEERTVGRANRFIIYKNEKNVKSRHSAMAKILVSIFMVGTTATGLYTLDMPKESTIMVIECIRSIPAGRVATYGGVAEMSGAYGQATGARQVVRILSAMSRKYDLPWWRIVRKDGRIALTDIDGKNLQRSLLEQEGVGFLEPYRVDLSKFGLR